MKTIISIKWALFIFALFLQTLNVDAQSIKEINFDEKMRKQNQEIQIGTFDNINISANFKNGKLANLVARDSLGKNTFPLYYIIESAQKGKGESNQVSTCKVCIDIVDANGKILTSLCYPINCADLLDLKSSLKSVNLEAKKKGGKDKKSNKNMIYSGPDYDIVKTVNKESNPQYKVVSKNKENYFIQYISDNSFAKNNNTTSCRVMVCKTIEDSKGVRTECIGKYIPCNQLPKPLPEKPTN